VVGRRSERSYRLGDEISVSVDRIEKVPEGRVSLTLAGQP
jgi:hypothetical protein